MPTGLARDIETQLKYCDKLRLICPAAKQIDDVLDPHHVLQSKFGDRLSFVYLPWHGDPKTWLFRRGEIRRILSEQAKMASVWHTVCSFSIDDLSTLSFYEGRKHASGKRVLCLDSDPASMLEKGKLLERFCAPAIRGRFQRWSAEVDGVIFVGKGVENSYCSFAKKFITTQAVWIYDKDVVDSESANLKFLEPQIQNVRMVLPSRLTSWKGIDDVLNALSRVGDQLGNWSLDIVGDGPKKKSLMEMLPRQQHQIRFLDPVKYGDDFFKLLRQYHLVIAPTRALEETRIVYDAAASGCALLHSATPTLLEALKEVEPRWSFKPGDINDLADAFIRAFEQRSSWSLAAFSGIKFMKGKTIDKMHQIRADFISSL